MDKFSCHTCGKTVTVYTRGQLYYWKEVKRMYCDRQCSLEYKRKISSITMKKANKKYAADISKRMREKNPTFAKSTREKIKETKMTNGTFHKEPRVKGGNGRVLPLPIQMLQRRLLWIATYIVPTKLKSPYPTHYKLELADPKNMLYIEVDGNSAYSRKEEAFRKEEFLRSGGWKLFRFTNKDVIKDLDTCLRTIFLVLDYRKKENEKSI